MIINFELDMIFTYAISPRDFGRNFGDNEEPLVRYRLPVA